MPDSQRIIDISAFFASRNGAPEKVREAFRDAVPCSASGSLDSGRGLGRVYKDVDQASCSARGSLEEEPTCGALREKDCQKLSSAAADNFPEPGSRSADSVNLDRRDELANSTNLEPGSVPADSVNLGCHDETADSMNPERRDEDSTARQIAARLQKGEVCVLPCDTIYGLSAVWGKAGEVALRSLKARDAGKPFIALATLEQVKNLADDLPMEIEALWPAPLTVILKLKMGGDQAFRVPGNSFLQKILSLTGSPIFSTSVNISGEAPLLSFSDIAERFGGKVDFLVKAGESQGSSPSTLLDATSRPYRILRQGVFQVPGTILK